MHTYSNEQSTDFKQGEGGRAGGSEGGRDIHVPIFTAARGKTGYWLMTGCSGGATEVGEGTWGEWVCVVWVAGTEVVWLLRATA